jgi:hypothetical protein
LNKNRQKAGNTLPLQELEAIDAELEKQQQSLPVPRGFAGASFSGRKYSAITGTGSD